MNQKVVDFSMYGQTCTFSQLLFRGVPTPECLLESDLSFDNPEVKRKKKPTITQVQFIKILSCVESGSNFLSTYFPPPHFFPGTLMGLVLAVCLCMVLGAVFFAYKNLYFAVLKKRYPDTY